MKQLTLGGVVKLAIGTTLGMILLAIGLLVGFVIWNLK